MHNKSSVTGSDKFDDSKKQNDYFRSLAYLAALPFHHLLSAGEILSSSHDLLVNNENSGTHLSAEKRWQIIQKAASEQNPAGADPVLLNNIISAKLFHENCSGEPFRTDWTAVLSEPLQGCAEIYRAEMFLFKRLIYEMKEDLTSPLILTDKDFSKYLDHEMFELLTGNGKPHRLLLNSLAAGFNISDSKIEENRKKKRENKNNSALTINDQNEAELKKKSLINGNQKRFVESESLVGENTLVLTDRIHGWESIPVAGDEELAEIERVSRRISFLVFGSSKEEVFEKSSEPWDKSPDDSTKSLPNKKEENRLTIYRLKIGSYWLRWREAAQAAGMDFKLLETLNDARAIRFYELTRFLRLASSGGNSEKLSNELEIDYELFMQIIPLPKFSEVNKIKKQVRDFIKPLKKFCNVKSITFKNCVPNNKFPVLVFRFTKDF